MHKLPVATLLLTSLLAGCTAVGALDGDVSGGNDVEDVGADDVGTIGARDTEGSADTRTDADASATDADADTATSDVLSDTLADADDASDGLADTNAGDAATDATTPDADAGADTFDDADTTPDAAADAAADAPADTVEDSGADVVADVAADVGEDAATDTAEPDVGPIVPPARGSYVYTRVSVTGLLELGAVDVHPDNDIALMVESTSVVRVYDFAASTISSITITPPTGTLYFEDASWSPDGTFALIMGRNVDGATESGFVFRIDDTILRTAADEAIGDAFAQLSPPAANAYAAIAWSPTDGRPVLLARNQTSPGVFNFALRRYTDATQSFAYVGGQPSTAGCQDLDFVLDDLGGMGIFVTCSEAGYDGWLYTAAGAWRHGAAELGNDTLGTAPRVAARPDGALAFVVSTSNRAVYRLEDGRINSAGAATRFASLPLTNAAFAPDGRRALVFGGVSTSTNRGVVLEYRYDEYVCATLGTLACGFTDVGIPNFQSPPWSAPATALMHDADWRTDCDGGLIVGGDDAYGLIAAFQLEGGVDCGW